LGHAESGQYYSLIRDESNSWFKFNDWRITAFNSSEISEESYGGKHEYDDYNSFGSGSRSKDAYMLVYDKVRKKPMIFERDKLPTVNNAIVINNLKSGKDLILVRSFSKYLRQEL
jgi:hypothetical protein